MFQSEIDYPLTSKWKKDYMQIQKACHNLWLVAAPFQIAMTKAMPRMGWRRGSQLGALSGSAPPFPGELERERQLEGLEAARILPDKEVGQDSGGGETLNIQQGASPCQA